MKKKHDENKDLQSLSRVCKVNVGSKTIKCGDLSKIGIRRWGKIDYLTRYCGWHFVYEKGAIAQVAIPLIIAEPNSTVRELKRQMKAPKLSDKRK